MEGRGVGWIVWQRCGYAGRRRPYLIERVFVCVRRQRVVPAWMWYGDMIVLLVGCTVLDRVECVSHGLLGSSAGLDFHFILNSISLAWRYRHCTSTGAASPCVCRSGAFVHDIVVFSWKRVNLLRYYERASIC